MDDRVSFLVFGVSHTSKSPEGDFEFEERACGYTPIRGMVIVLICCLLMVCSSPTQAQSITPSPYELKWQKELPLTLIPIVGLGISRRLGQTKPILTETEINQLSINNIPKFDRFSVNQYSVTSHTLSDIFLFGSTLLPLTFLLDKDLRRSDGAIGQTGMIAVETFLLTTAVTTLTKELVQRKRPFVYNPSVPLSEKMKRDATTSFFSGHTSVTASSSFLFAQLFNDFYPDSKARYFVWSGAALAPAITGFLRMKGGKHFLSDVVIGYLVGGAIGILVPRLHHRK